ncbi:Putative patatin-like phospholipase [endosymbiont DhMRE of Dentiscutata heterogama]|uniref:hypothetical protein n=1 Tax=endosymbiont DhMRE of Dentiscutata heterogama TaxID=1609546 RepID=UPI000629D665|nr:hypothetical protein [endosymbiont DhMRE of Dentiscutata heterogama]CFW93432.1 Putative patatin-like phospholipase [endosymbiont DhMRE of Dentiscutata heterogama]
MTKKQLKAMPGNHRTAITTENREVIQELREIKSDIKEVKKFLIINSLRQLVVNYDQQTEKKKQKLAKDWELAEKDEQRNKEIAEWDQIQEEDEKNSNS